MLGFQINQKKGMKFDSHLLMHLQNNLQEEGLIYFFKRDMTLRVIIFTLSVTLLRWCDNVIVSIKIISFLSV